MQFRIWAMVARRSFHRAHVSGESVACRRPPVAAGFVGRDLALLLLFRAAARALADVLSGFRTVFDHVLATDSAAAGV